MLGDERRITPLLRSSVVVELLNLGASTVRQREGGGVESEGVGEGGGRGVVVGVGSVGG